MLVSESIGDRAVDMSIAGQKRTQHCTFCKNHGLNTPKKGHHCPHINCPCLLCKLTKKAQMAMRHQQRVWRHQKQKLKSLKFDDDETSAPENKTNKSQACDKCRNHSVLKLKRNHQCPFQNCQCEYCSLTFKRREVMKHQQRVRRSKITSKMNAETRLIPSKMIAEAQPIREETEDKEYSYYKNEGPVTPEKPSCVGYTDDEDSNQGKRDVQPNKLQMERYEPMDTLHLSSISEEGKREPFLGHPMDSQNEMKHRESPPPLIHMSNHPSPLQLSSRSTRSVSPPPYSHFDHALRNETPSPSHAHFGRDSSPLFGRDSSPLRFDSSHESSREGSRQTSPLIFHRGSSPSSSPPFRPFPFTPSQPLQSLSALNASLDPAISSIKFGSHLEDLHLRNCNWLSPSFIGSSFARMPHSSFLHAQQPLHHHRLHTTHQPIRPLPLNASHTHHPTAFPQELWNRMFLPFNLGLQPNIPDPRFERFPSFVDAARFSSRDIFHSA